MPIDLSKQRLYTTRIPDSRYPYGAFNTSYQNGVFSAILRDDLVAGDVYMYYVKDEKAINYTDVVWFVAFLVYDDARVMQDADCIIEKIDEKLRENLFDEKLFELNKKVLTTNLVRLFESPSNVASMIYNYIIKHGEIIENAYDIYKNYDFDEFKHEFNTLNFDNKSVLYVTKKE